MATLALRWNHSRHSANSATDLEDAIQQCRLGLVDTVTVHTPHAHVRCQVHDIVKRRYPGMRHESRDETSAGAAERVLCIWSEDRAIDAALDLMAGPPCQVQNAEGRRATAQPPSPARRSQYAPRLRYCDFCGDDSDHVEILRNVHTAAQYCDACIEANDELSTHKREP